MSLFAIADLHLSLSVDKPMDIFGEHWSNHVERLTQNWNETVTNNDIVVIPGDISWGINLEEAKADIDYINRLNGTKIISKGNHDYWWSTISKLNAFLNDNGFDTIKFLHNNHYAYGNYGICGTRGWINETSVPADAKVLAREAQRLEVSIQSALKENLEPIVFLHYPPVFGNESNYDILDVMYKYNVKECYYGHLHGNSHKYAVCGEREGINFHLISGDFVQFYPKLVL
ncbi:MAG: metallophosphoesterase [Oscillospiraceae bacterium]